MSDNLKSFVDYSEAFQQYFDGQKKSLDSELTIFESQKDREFTRLLIYMQNRSFLDKNQWELSQKLLIEDILEWMEYRNIKASRISEKLYNRYLWLQKLAEEDDTDIETRIYLKEELLITKEEELFMDRQKSVLFDNARHGILRK